MAGKLLVLDNYDSFTYNLVHLLRELGETELDVRRNDQITVDEAGRYDRIVLSPGPGIPNEAGIMPELVRRLAPKKRILGICLGHQCIGEVFGGTLENIGVPIHGKATETRVLDGSEPIFRNLPTRLMTGRYHSWVVRREGFPEALKVTAEDDSGMIMALAHRTYDVRGLQFHPESVLTPDGRSLLRNWLEGV